jgi:hypothetical protein
MSGIDDQKEYTQVWLDFPLFFHRKGNCAQLSLIGSGEECRIEILFEKYFVKI